jgi:hypothetical protein
MLHAIYPYGECTAAKTNAIKAVDSEVCDNLGLFPFL